MPPLPRFSRALGLAVACTLVLDACTTRDAHIQPDAAFTPYIPAFTAGHISARSPILVHIADGQRWRDTTKAAIQDLFDLDPGVKGTVQWEDDRTLAFVPAERLEQDRTYTVSFKLGRLIEVPNGLEVFKFQVSTYKQDLDVKVSDMQSLSATDLTWQRLIVSVYTSDDATGQDLDGCFSATQQGRKLPLTWEHEPNGRYHRFTADSVRRGDKASLVEISWNGKKIGSRRMQPRCPSMFPPSGTSCSSAPPPSVRTSNTPPCSSAIRWIRTRSSMASSGSTVPRECASASKAARCSSTPPIA